MSALHNPIASARQYRSAGNITMAERAYQDAIALEPENVEAWEFLIRIRLSSKETLAAIALLGKVPERIRFDPNIQLLSGLALYAIGDLKSAETALRNASESILIAGLHLAAVLDEAARHDEALVHYFRALTGLQQQGVCLDESTTPPPIRGLVLEAMRRINEGRLTLFQAYLEPHIRLHGRESLKRIEEALLVYLGELPAAYQDPRQRPTFFYVPGLPPVTYYPLHDFAWVQELERQTDTIREELSALMRTGEGIEAVHQLTGPELEAYVRSDREGANWKGAYFYRHGKCQTANAARCPATFRAIESLPLSRVRDHSPEVLFSVLDPGTEILNHRGVTNSRLVLHLPLIVPPDCALDVSGEIHAWQEGRCIMFDDTFEHRAWNRSNEIRVLLIADVWNPHLTLPERDALSDLIAGIGDFNRQCDL